MQYIIGILVFAVLVGVDQWTKYLVLTRLAGADPVMLFDGLVKLHYVQNTGAAFSMFSNKTWLLSVITAAILIVAAVLLLMKKIPGKVKQTAVLLILSGGFGNLLDRVLRHYVVDFIDLMFIRFAVFNFADCCVTIGAAILIISLILDIFKETRAESSEKDLHHE